MTTVVYGQTIASNSGGQLKIASLLLAIVAHKNPMDHFVCLVPIVFELIFHVLLLHALVRAFRAIINNKANKIAVLTLLVF